MTEDEKLVEKVAEAMWEHPVHPQRFSWKQLNAIHAEDRERADDIRECARAAIAAVRENDGKGLVHADSTGAERSSDLSSGNSQSSVFFFRNRLYIVEPTKIPAEFTFEDVWPTDDRSAPAASREPNLFPSSLTAPHRHMKGGIQG